MKGPTNVTGALVPRDATLSASDLTSMQPVEKRLRAMFVAVDSQARQP